MAAGVVRVAFNLGIAVPEELSVAGCDDVALARQIFPALTTIRQPLSEMAGHATLALIRQSFGEAPATEAEIIQGSLKIRQSTGPAPD